MNPENLLEIKGLGKTFHLHNLNKEITALKGLDLNLRKGEFGAVIGRSGSGKSTILKSIYRTYLPYEGEIWYHSEKFGPVDLAALDERRIIYLRRYEIAYVSQFLKVIPRTTAIEITEKSVLEMGEDKKIAREKAAEILRHFQLNENLWDSYPSTFSGGEKLRLNIASAMIKKPRLLLLDEPTASLDNQSKEKVRELIQQLKTEGCTMLGIFHDIEFMEGLCDFFHELRPAG